MADRAVLSPGGAGAQTGKRRSKNRLFRPNVIDNREADKRYSGPPRRSMGI